MSNIVRGIFVESGFYGDGSDGDGVISVDTNMTRARFYRYLTVESGVTLSTKNFPLYVQRLLINYGRISADGGHGANATTTGGTGGAGLANETATGDSGITGCRFVC